VLNNYLLFINYCITPITV